MSHMHVRQAGTSGCREVQPDMCRHVQIVMNTSRKGKKKKKTPTYRLRQAGALTYDVLHQCIDT